MSLLVNHLRCTYHPATQGENAVGLVGGGLGGNCNGQERGLSDEKEAAASVQEEGQQVESPEYKNPVGLEGAESMQPEPESDGERLVETGPRREALRGS